MDRIELTKHAKKWAVVLDLLGAHASDADLSAAMRDIYPWIVASPAPAPAPQEVHIPSKILDDLRELWGLQPDQIDTIMRLVSLPENGSSRWWDFYNYIEYGDDASIRGFTTTIFGATTGTGSMLKVFDKLAEIQPKHPLLKYHAALRKARGGSIAGLEGLAHVGGDPTKAKANYDAHTADGRTHLNHIQGDLATLSNADPSWQLAVWQAFVELNWQSAAQFCAKTNGCVSRPGPVLVSPLAKGFLVDTSLNHGDARYWNDADTWKCIWKEMKDPHAGDEMVWLRDFMKARQKVLKSGYAGLDWSKTGDRCLLWMHLLKTKNTELTRPIQIPKSTATPYPIWTEGLVIQPVVSSTPR